MRKRERQRRLWEESLELVYSAFRASASGWASIQAERQQFIKERENLLWKIELLTKACEGSRITREKLCRENKELKEKNLQLQSELKELNETLDMISAEDNGELIRRIYGKRGA